MAKRTKKISINLTEDEFNLLATLARVERRSISELAALIIVDTSQQLYFEKYGKGNLEVAHFYPSNWNINKHN